jgi:hypothetical protein
MADWYYVRPGMIRDETIGPVDTDTLAKRIKRGELTPETILSSPEKTGNKLVRMSAFPKLVEIYEEGERERAREAERAKEAKLEARELAKREKELTKQEKLSAQVAKKEAERARAIQSSLPPVVVQQAAPQPASARQVAPQPGYVQQIVSRPATVQEVGKNADAVLYRASPAMFRNAPIRFVLTCCLCLFLIGIPIMIVWWLTCKCTEITITDSKVILREGILSKNLNEVRHSHIRNVLLRQSFLQRIFDVGWIGLSTAGQSGMELEIGGIPSPAHAKAIIDERIS